MATILDKFDATKRKAMYLENFQYQNILIHNRHQPKPELLGYSSIEMHNILYHPFGPHSPLSLQTLSAEEYQIVPLLNQMKYYLGLIQKVGALKLTAKGYLPTKTVRDLYHQGFLEEVNFETDHLYLFKEKDSMTANLTRILAEISGFTKKRNGKLSLTKYGEKTLSDTPALLEMLLKSFTLKFNWAYYDGFGNNQIGQYGYGFSLVLLSKFGATKHQDLFYADKYFTAFPELLANETPSQFKTARENASVCYSLRTFERFLNYLGVIKIETEGDKYFPDIFITKSELFDKLIQVSPHKTNYLVK